MLPKLCLNLWFFCLSLPAYGDYRYALSCLAYCRTAEVLCCILNGCGRSLGQIGGRTSRFFFLFWFWGLYQELSHWPTYPAFLCFCNRIFLRCWGWSWICHLLASDYSWTPGLTGSDSFKKVLICNRNREITYRQRKGSNKNSVKLLLY